MEQVVIGLIGVVMLWRYKPLILMMVLVYSIKYIGRIASHLYTPGVAKVHTPPGLVIDNVLEPLVLLMLVLSLWEQKA